MKRNIIPKHKLAQKLIGKSNVIVSDALMKRYFGMSWREYKKKYDIE